MQLVLRQWLIPIEDSEQKKLVITDKGLILWDKWVEIQKMVGIKSKRKVMFPKSKMKPSLVK